MNPSEETLGGVSLAWIDMVAGCLAREGRAFRAGAGAWIEVQNIATAQWETLTLETRRAGDCAFAATVDRDLVLARLEARVRSACYLAQPAGELGLLEQPAAGFTPEERARSTAILNTLSAVASAR